MSGPWTHHSDSGVRIPPSSIRMITLSQNRGKGGAVTHGMRHARGQYVLFADADGATNFPDLSKLVDACEEKCDSQQRGVAVGSRAHLVGSAEVVQRSKLRNLLMYGFHLYFVPPHATFDTADKRYAMRFLNSSVGIPYPSLFLICTAEGWIFDVEMLMLAEFAGIPVIEVAVGWREVVGSKLNVVRDSIGMAWGLLVLRVCWGVGFWRR